MLSECVWLKSILVYFLLIEAPFENKQPIMVDDNETAKLQAKVEGLEATSAEKDTLIAECEALVKESEGLII